MGWYERIPKVELHLHLEGSIPHEALWELIQKYGGDALAPNLETLKQRYRYRDFPHFIEVWSWQNRFLREYDDFEFVSEAVARDLARQNYRYVELMLSPSLFRRRGLQTQELALAVKKGLSKVENLQASLIVDLVRDYGPEKESRTLSELADIKSKIIGIGIGGSEHEYPPKPFAELFEHARDLGFHTMAHAGEAAGAESVWSAVRDLRVERIGHGTRAAEDVSLLNHLVKKRIPVDMCPLSNVRTGVTKTLAHHPIREFMQRGILVSVNTDDPKMFGNSLAEEFQLLEQVFHLNRKDIKTLTSNAIRASWLPQDEKVRMENTVLGDAVWRL
jgi:adenosine deaminase